MRLTSLQVFSLSLVYLAILPAAAQTRSTLDTELPVTAVELRACEHMHTDAPPGHATDFWFDPYKLKGVQPEAGKQIYGILVPRTPVYMFLFNWAETFKQYPVSLPKHIDCGVVVRLDEDRHVSWKNVPDGDYLVTIITQTPRTYNGSTASSSTGYNLGGPVTVTTYTPYSRNYIAQEVQHIAIHTSGGKLTTAPEWGIVR